MKNALKTLSVSLFMFLAFAVLPGGKAEAKQLCTPFSVFGQVTNGEIAVDGANVTLTNNATLGAMQMVSEQGGFYLFETANLDPCLEIGNEITVLAQMPGLSGNQTFIFSGGALQELNLALLPLDPG